MSKKTFINEKSRLIKKVIYLKKKKKITNVCVFNKRNKQKTTGVLHIHNLINSLK